ncbi:PucR family transcriptional regulator [Pseudonocardia xinjiangensis]|uniref:PucR family transcriptional regulator n=1 Tax=Pseudonocardia xinjiangensis TaxID=75289 RepID=A0ABX1RP24_9PSEU|nr:helix-turn-helix domain-containing protein [Pseudonocardia xinjiangensis]NMH81624.1 PucR family transcriptional regulator [Pseudonocardia xinjiangensis]
MLPTRRGAGESRPDTGTRSGTGGRPLPPESADALRVLGGVLIDEVDGLADRLTVMVLHREPTYAELDMVEELRGACRANMERGVQTLAEQVPDGVDPEDTSRQTGRRRARQGVPLEVVLRAYRLGGRVMWEALLSASRGRFSGRYDTALLDAASYVWRVNDRSATALVEAYRLEELRLQSHDLSRRHAVLDGLIEGRGGDPAFLRDAATVLGLPERGPMLCVVTPVEPSGEDSLRSPQEALAPLGIVSSWFLRPRDEVGVVALGSRPPEVVADALRPCVAGRVGVSPVVDGLGAIDAGYRMAHTAARTLVGPGLAVLDERLPEALLVDSPELVPRVVRTALGGLLDLPPADRDTLLETLRELLANGGSPTHAAAALFCHRNTVIYRVRRIEAATGRSIADPRDRLLLTLGVLAAQSSGLP